jgi:hypothetical protein
MQGRGGRYQAFVAAFFLSLFSGEVGENTGTRQ